MKLFLVIFSLLFSLNVYAEKNEKFSNISYEISDAEKQHIILFNIYEYSRLLLLNKSMINEKLLSCNYTQDKINKYIDWLEKLNYSFKILINMNGNLGNNYSYYNDKNILLFKELQCHEFDKLFLLFD